MSARESIHDGVSARRVSARRVGTCGSPDCGEAIYSDDARGCETYELYGYCRDCVHEGEIAYRECMSAARGEL